MPLTKDSDGRSVVPIVINDKPLPIDSSRVVPVKSSATGETVHYFAATDVATCDKACEAAYEAFQGGWKRSTVSTRRNLLNKAADLFEQRKDDLIKSQCEETACDEHWAANNVALTAAYIREIAACISSIRGAYYCDVFWPRMAYVY